MTSAVHSLVRSGQLGRGRGRSTTGGIITPRVISLFLLLLAVVALFTALIPHFLTANSLLNLARQTTVSTIVAMGTTFVITAGEFDLSVGAVVALSSVMIAWSSRLGYSIPVMLLSALLAGLAVGAVNGLLVLKFRVPSFLATLGTLFIVRGLAMTISLDPMPVRSLGFIKFFRMSPAGIPMPVLIALFVFAGALVLFNYSRFGVYTRALGSNEGAARVAGLDTTRFKYIVLVLSAAVAAIGGIVLSGRTDYGMAQSAAGLELEVIAAVILGGTRLGGGVGSIVGSLLGALLFTVIFMGIATIGLPGPYQDIAKGGAIAIAILLMRR